MLTRKFRPFALLFGAFVLVALVAVTAFRVYGSSDLTTAAAAFEAEVHPLDLESFLRPTVPDAQNAAHWIQAAGAALALEEEDVEFLRGNFLEDDSTFDVERARALLATNQPALDLLHRATGLDRANYHLDYPAGLDMEIPNLLSHLHASFLLLLESRVALHDGRWDDALRAHGAQRRVAVVLSEETPLIFQLVGLVVEKTAWKGVQWMLAAGLDDPATLRALRQPLYTVAPLERFRRSMGGEGACFYAMRDRLDGVGEWVPDLSWWQKQQLRYRPEPNLAKILEGFRLLSQSYPENTARQLADDPRLNGSHLFGPMGILVGNLTDAAYKFKHAEAIALLVDEALALRLRGVEEGAYPATWKATPSPYSGQAFRYETQADGSVILSAPGMIPTLEELRPNGPLNTLDRWALPPVALQ
jgi:hypothetical protein